MPLKPIAMSRFMSGAVGVVSAKIRAKMISPEQAVLIPGRAFDVAEIAWRFFEFDLCLQSISDRYWKPQLAHDALTSADLERDG